MSAFSEYSAASDHNTAIFRHTSADALDGLYPLACVPVSGDMLAILKRGTRTTQTKRRALAQQIIREAKQ